MNAFDEALKAARAERDELAARVASTDELIRLLEERAGPVMHRPAPKRAREPKPAAALPPADAPGKRGGRPSGEEAQKRDEQVTKLFNAGNSPTAIARTLGVTSSAIYLRLKRLGLSRDEAPAAQAEPASQEPLALGPLEVAKFLNECGERTKPEGNKWSINGRPAVDSIALLDHANVMRRRMKQAPFKYADTRH